jgi:hypothetical protein
LLNDLDKTETRNPKSESNSNPKPETGLPGITDLAPLRVSGFGHSFGFLVSDFGLQTGLYHNSLFTMDKRRRPDYSPSGWSAERYRFRDSFISASQSFLPSLLPFGPGFWPLSI